MLNYSKTARFLLTLLALSIAVWLGSSVIRSAIAFDLYIPSTELKLKEEYSDSRRTQIVEFYTRAALYTGTSYSIAVISVISLLIIYRRDLKKKGWIFMSFILFFLSVPYEFISLYMDIHLNLMFNSRQITSFTNQAIKDYFIIKLTKFTVWGSLSALCVISAIVIIIWRPLNYLDNLKVK